MDLTIYALAIILTGTLLLAFAIDRGIPNTMDSLAFAVERCSRAVVKYMRQFAERLRARHNAIQMAHRERLEQEPAP